ncbi:hypothetical protein IGB42_01572 [Andreprevotia sp. IGB-42]|nr:hypothetical protein IGB42_01572 [Andreprevotia sp. IGB-42]
MAIAFLVRNNAEWIFHAGQAACTVMRQIPDRFAAQVARLAMKAGGAAKKSGPAK